jgi:Tfp pilus assembly ATPase PilU
MMTNKADGNQLLNEALFKLIADGLVTPEDALFKSIDKNSFLITAKQRGIVFAA